MKLLISSQYKFTEIRLPLWAEVENSIWKQAHELIKDPVWIDIRSRICFNVQDIIIEEELK